MSKYLLKEHFHEFLLVFSEEIDVNFIRPNFFRTIIKLISEGI